MLARIVDDMRPIILISVLAVMLVSLAATAQPRVVVEKDVVYGNGGGLPLRLDFYRPAVDSRGRIPAVVWIHGGGWNDGDKRDKPDLESLARRGYFAASINHRPSSVAPFPAAVEDAKCAVRWVRSHAREYGVDPDRIGAWGFSSGAHLALMLAYSPAAAGLEGSGGNAGVSSQVQAVCAFAGPTDFSQGHQVFESGRGLGPLNFFGGTLEQKPDLYRRASPVNYVTSKVPPTLLVHGDRDRTVPFWQSEELLAKLKAKGVEATLIRVQGGGHELNKSSSLPNLIKAAFEFFDRHLKVTRTTATRGGTE